MSTLSIIAKPLADEEKESRIFKTIKKAQSGKKIIFGVKSVNKAIRKGNKGIVVIAGDITPIDIVSHYPVYCEENKLPYIFVHSKDELGKACASTRPMSVCFVREPATGDDYEDNYSKVKKYLKKKDE
jgi:H/ACA ribonucleoprotein complex subunit 2